MTYRIDTDVPIPASGSGRPLKAGGLSQALRDLATAPVGSSILVTDVSRNKVSGYITNTTKVTSASFASRSVEGGVRVWRTA